MALLCWGLEDKGGLGSVSSHTVKYPGMSGHPKSLGSSALNLFPSLPPPYGSKVSLFTPIPHHSHLRRALKKAKSKTF